MKACFDTNIVIDALNGLEEADQEYRRYERVLISRITWMEVLIGAKNDEASLRDFLEKQFEIVPLEIQVAEEAVQLRRSHPLRLPDAIIWATARVNQAVLVSRNTKDFTLIGMESAFHIIYNPARKHIAGEIIKQRTASSIWKPFLLFPGYCHSPFDDNPRIDALPAAAERYAPQFFENGFQVALDGVGGYHQALGNFLVWSCRPPAGPGLHARARSGRQAHSWPGRWRAFHRWRGGKRRDRRSVFSR